MREQFETYWATLKDLADPIQKETAYLFFMRGWFSHQDRTIKEMRNMAYLEEQNELCTE